MTLTSFGVTLTAPTKFGLASVSMVPMPITVAVCQNNKERTKLNWVSLITPKNLTQNSNQTRLNLT